MSSSDGSGPAGESALTAGPEDAKQASNGLRPEGDREAERDPWFDPAPRNSAAGASDQNGSGQAGWFLPSGRAGLLPDSMSVSSDDTAEHLRGPAEASGAPPWSEDLPDSASSPPPWESGPWPGPGGDYVPTRRRDQGTSESLVGSVRLTASHMPEQAPGWPPTAVVAVGAMPLVIPGLIVGALSLRRARATGSSQFSSFLALGLSLLWAVVIIIVVVASSGGGASGCANYSGALRPAYERAVADLSAGRPGRAAEADLATAVSQANKTEAAAQNVSERAALSALAGDLKRALTQATEHPSRPSRLSPQLSSDWSALTASCPG